MTRVSRERIARLRERFENLRIYYNEFGQVDFSEYMEASVRIPNPVATNYGELAWQQLDEDLPDVFQRVINNRDNLVWHHTQDGQLQLVDRDLHIAFQHTGLQAVMRDGAIMIVPGLSSLLEGHVSDAAREAAMEVAMSSSIVISTSFSAYFDWIWADMYGTSFEEEYAEYREEAFERISDDVRTWDPFGSLFGGGDD